MSHKNYRNDESVASLDSSRLRQSGEVLDKIKSPARSDITTSGDLSLQGFYSKSEIYNNLLYQPQRTFTRPDQYVPFHIPHKKLLEKIEHKVELPEPLTGFAEIQEKMKRRTLPPIDQKLLDKVKSATSTDEPPLKARKLGDSFLLRKPRLEHISRRSKPKDIVDQKEIIALVRSAHPDFNFFYMIYAVDPSSEYYNPYCLRIVPYEQIDKHNFLTISTKGVAQYYDNQMHFTPLSVWEHEYDLYVKVQRIKLFHLYRQWKTFFIWRKQVVLRKFNSASQFLNKNLFILNSHLQTALLAVQTRCASFRNAQFCYTKKKEDYLLYYFVYDQHSQIIELENRLKEFRSASKQIVLDACLRTLQEAGFTLDDHEFLKPANIPAKNLKDIPKMSYIEQARKRDTCQRLSCFIALIDFLIINMLHELVAESFRNFSSLIHKHIAYMPREEDVVDTDIDFEFDVKRPMKPLLKFELLLNPEELYFDPTEEQTREAFENIFKYWEDIYYKEFEPFILDTIFDPFISPMIDGNVESRLVGLKPSLRDVLNGNEKIIQQHRQVFKDLEISWKAMKSYINRFEDIRKFYAEDCATDRNSIRNETNLSALRNLLKRYYYELETIGRIIDYQEIGLFSLKITAIKETCNPHPTNLISVIHEILPVIGKNKVQKIMQDIHENNQYLDQEPLTTQGFVDYLMFLEQITMKVDLLESDLDYVKELYDLTDEYEISIAYEDQDAYLNCGTYIQTLRSNCDSKISQRDRIIDKLSDSIDQDISALTEEIMGIRTEIMRPALIDIKSDPKQVLKQLNELQQSLNACQEKAQTFKQIQKQYRLEVTRYELLEQAINEVKLRTMLWDMWTSWNRTIKEWYESDFDKLNIDDISDFTLRAIKNVNALERGLPVNDIVMTLKEAAEVMKDKLLVIQYLRNPSLRNRHWRQIEDILKYKFKPNEKITLQLLENLYCFNYSEQLMEIAGQASSEASLEAMLKKVDNNWKALEFFILPYRDTKDVFILGSTEEIQTILDDSLITVNTVAASRHAGPIKHKVDEWLTKLNLFSKVLDEWLSVQQQWMYLEVIFSAPDIQRQLPREAKMFILVDKSYKEIMRKTAKVPLALAAATAPGVLDTFVKCSEILDQIMKCLEAYLEVKRVAFPRFYFLSNDELLEILAQTKNPHAVQPHLRKCFDAIAKLQFGQKVLEELEEEDEEEDDDDEKPKTEKDVQYVMTNDIEAMISPEGEIVDLGKGLKARGNVEDWLGKVENAMFTTLRRKMKEAIRDFANQPRKEWLTTHANQIILTVSQIIWAREVHEVFDSRGDKIKMMGEVEDNNLKSLNQLAEFVRGDLDKIVRKILIALITISVHARDCVSQLVQDRVTSSEDFQWLKMLRYYWDKVIDNCLTRMSNAQYVYGYEYLGAGGCLVITPLTDRCYLCLMGALQLDLGGAPAGPAGTGKTETTKDLAKSLAIQCVVFNCSEGLDYRMMGRFFSGLAQSGAWCCFDEFNRINIEVLSVIAQQLITIRNAKVAGLKKFLFEGREIKLVRQCAAFITMNPGYAGRTELPDNLKSLFRPIAMMVPDYALIAEVTLYSEGFVSSKVLAKKMTQMYKLCSEQLSQQDHYDFGMRAVKSVLVMAGALKRASPDVKEDLTLIRAIKDSNLPKFLADDAVLFQGILSDLFPGVILPEPDYGSFQDAIIYCQTSNGLQPELSQVRKVIQLHETMIVRWGVMLVGPTGGGKSTVLKILGCALTKMHTDGIPGQYYQPVQTYILNPKSVAIGELYGEVNLLTMEWRDGLLGIAVRKAVNQTNEDHQWVICDGPVDAVWIENLNTVLDDNKMLCLANSERIKLTPYVHMVFEVQDLSQASPATVSRCGMVYIDPTELKWMPYVKTWIEKIDEELLPEELKDYLIDEVFSVFVDKAFEYIRRHCEHTIHQVDISKVTMVCTLMESIIKSLTREQGKTIDKKFLKTIVSQIFVFSLLWGLGGNLTSDTRDKFETYLRSELFIDFEDAQLPEANLWNIYLDHDSKKMQMWSAIMPNFQYDNTIPFFDLLVPTIDTCRFGYLMEKLLAQNAPIMFTGDTGVGKSVIAKSVLNKLYNSGEWVTVTLNFSAQTSSLRTQEMIETKLERKRKTLLGAPIGKKVVVFVDDVNMPKLEIYGAQPPVELLRQFLDYKGLYDRQKMFWKQIADVVLTCACAPPGGGRNPLTPRFVRHFGMLAIPAPSDVSMKVIFTAIIQGFFDDFTKEIQALSEPFVNAAVGVYLKIKSDLLPTPDKSHYVFNLRDLSKCIQGVLQADSGTMREQNAIKRLFYHECLRVFGDRLINFNDKTYFCYLLKEVCSQHIGDPIIDLPENKNDLTVLPTLLFGDFMNTTIAKEERLYEEIKDLEKLKIIYQEYLEDYNLTAKKPMNLIFFQDALEHTTILARILRAERGNALLVGVSGMGKQSLTKLASHVNQCKVSEIELTRNYDHNSFFEDIRNMYFNAGCKNIQTTFLFTDTKIIQEEFLEDINNILNSGDVPNLFTGDDYEKVMSTILEPAKKAGVSGSRDILYDFFIGRVRSNLHLAICMSPVGDDFRRRCRMFPSLVNCCTIDWFTKWPTAALYSVATRGLQGVAEDETLVQNLSTICVAMHESVEEMTVRYFNEMRRYYYTTPSSYLELIRLFRYMLKEKHTEIVQARERIANGLKKLYEANSVVDSMKAEIIKMAPIIKAKNETVARIVQDVTLKTKEADKVRETVMRDQESAKIKAETCKALADEAQKDLDKAMPAMRAAEAALGALNKKDINELRVFTQPPEMVRWVLEPVCILLDTKTDWDSAKKVMGENFLKRLREYDINHIPDRILKKLVPYLENKNFQPEIVEKVSKVCGSMVLWVRALDMYAKVYKVVGPKIIRQQEAEKELQEVMNLLKSKQKMLADVEEHIQELKTQLQERMDEREKLQQMMDLTSKRLINAGRLTAALGDEQERWESLIENYERQLGNLIGDILVASASVAYLGAFTSNYRTELVKQWCKMVKELNIPSLPTFNLIKLLTDDFEIRMWNTCGLPKDAISTENAIFVTRAGRWPLMIDPQEQANRWVRALEGPNGLKITKLTDPNFMRTLEAAIRVGVPVLLQEVGETLDPTLSPILRKQTTMQGGRRMIRLGDTDIEYDDNFRFYVTTKLSNPHFLPEVCISVTLVNFTVTPKGLEDQLLADVVGLERPDLEKLRTECVVRINEDKNQLTMIEDKILQLLYASTGNILDDEELIDTLNESKETSAVIASRLVDAEKARAEISVAREKYRTVATRGSILFFVVMTLAEIDPMYQFSLKYFNNIFDNVIRISEKNSDLTIRLQILYREITLAIYTNISRGLFEEHKLVFSFLLCINILMNVGEISELKWSFLIRGAVGAKITRTKPDLAALTDQKWTNILYLVNTFGDKFKGLASDCTKLITLNIGDYEESVSVIYGATEEADFDWNSKLDEFEKLMLVRAIQEEKLVFCITNFVKLKLGQAFVESPQISLNLLYQDISNTIPLIFVLSTGSDPFQSFQRFASEMGFSEKIQSISLGQGQGPIAEKMIEKARMKGDWVFLQNCHLAVSWMLQMERLIMKLSERGTKVHSDFRLYLSSMPCKEFPVSVLQNSVKVTNEPPKGLRSNIKRALTDISSDFFENHPLENDWRKIIFGICFFHGIIQERKKFGPLGWNIIYSFNDSDRECAFLNFQMFCKVGYIPWDALEYITGEITYGGRVTDEWDQRCLKTILKGYFSEPTLEPGYKYSPSGIYYCPEGEKIDEFKEYVDNLPLIEEPEIFGMHENANIVYQIKETRLILNTILQSQPKASSEGTGKSSDEIVDELATMIRATIYAKIDSTEPYGPLFERDSKGRLPSLTTVLTQEIDRFNKLLVLIHTSMEQLQKAIKGLVVMSEQLEEVYVAFTNNRVPSLWASKAYPSMKSLGSWITDLQLRLDFIFKWLLFGKPPSIWISGLFFPQGFLTGCLQTHSRKYDIPIDTLVFEFQVTDNIIDQEYIKAVHDRKQIEFPEAYGVLPPIKDGTIIHGLFLDAGRWDFETKMLADPYPGEMSPPLPAMVLTPVTQYPVNDTRYIAPLYKTAVRAGVLSTTGHSTNFVMPVRLPSFETSSYWIIRGTALLAQITN